MNGGHGASASVGEQERETVGRTDADGRSPRAADQGIGFARLGRNAFRGFHDATAVDLSARP